MDFRIKGRVAFIGGASKGMGLGIARELAKEGVKVAMVARGGAKLEAEARAIVDQGGEAVAIAADLSSKPGTIAAVEATREAFGDPDIAVSMAYFVHPEHGGGTTPGRGFAATTDDQFQSATRDFVMPVVWLTREVLPHMQRQKWGRLINVGSCAAKEPHWKDPLILANLRVVVSGLMKTLANEYAPYGITANVIAPGPVLTETNTEGYLMDAGVPEIMNTVEKWTTFIPAGRMGTIEDAGALGCFLASDRAGWLTGQTITLDGGYIKSLF